MKYILPVGVLVLNVLYRTAAFVSPDAESPEPFASAVLMGVEENATIVTGTWDFLYSPVLALQHVRGMRRDVRMIDLHLLRDRSWYVQDVIGWAGDGNDMLRQRAGAFLAELKKFEEGRPFAAQVIQMRWQEFLTQLLAGLGAAGPVYVDHGIVGELPRVFDYRPEGYLLRAVDSVSVGGSRQIPEYWPIGEKNDIFAASYRRFCSTAFLNHALYDRSNGDTLQARESLRQASIIDPGNPHLRLAW